MHARSMASLSARTEHGVVATSRLRLIRAPAAVCEGVVAERTYVPPLCHFQVVSFGRFPGLRRGMSWERSLGAALNNGARGLHGQRLSSVLRRRGL